MNIVPHGPRMVNVKIERITCFHIVQPLVDYVVFRKRWNPTCSMNKVVTNAWIIASKLGWCPLFLCGRKLSQSYFFLVFACLYVLCPCSINMHVGLFLVCLLYGWIIPLFVAIYKRDLQTFSAIIKVCAKSVRVKFKILFHCIFCAFTGTVWYGQHVDCVRPRLDTCRNTAHQPVVNVSPDIKLCQDGCVTTYRISVKPGLNMACVNRNQLIWRRTAANHVVGWF